MQTLFPQSIRSLCGKYFFRHTLKGERMKKVDARGLSCPEPVIRAKNAMESGDKEYEILVDNVVAKENVSRFATHQGYQVQATEQGDDILLKLTK